MKSDSIKDLTAALAKAQLAFKPIKRTEKVDYATTGGRKKYTYAPLDEIIEAAKEALSTNGLVITQSTYLQAGNTILETLLLHSSGEWLSGELYVGKQDQPPQSEGSSLTYKRRYGMSAILGVASEEDDDVEGTTDRKEKPSQPLSKASIVSTSLKEKASPVVPLAGEPAQQGQESKVGNGDKTKLPDFKTGTELVNFALKQGMRLEKIREILTIDNPTDIKDVKAATAVLFTETKEEA